MILEIYDKHYAQIGHIQNVDSITWNRKLYAPAEFSISSSVLNPLWKIGNVVRFTDSMEHVGFIEQVSYTTGDDGLKVEIRGRDAISMLDWRVLSTQWLQTTSPMSAIAEIIEREKRGMSVSVTVQEDDEREAYYNYPIGTGLLRIVQEIAQANNINIKYSFTPSVGIELSFEYADNEAIGTFDINNGTLLSQEYDESIHTYKNVIFAHNGASGDDLVVNEVGDAVGDERREVYMAYDVSDETGGVMPLPTEYFPGSVTVEPASGADYSFSLDGKWYSQPFIPTYYNPPPYGKTYKIASVIRIHANQNTKFAVDVFHEEYYLQDGDLKPQNVTDSEEFIAPDSHIALGKLDTVIPVNQIDPSRQDIYEWKDIFYRPGESYYQVAIDGTVEYDIPQGDHFIMVYGEASENLSYGYQEGRSWSVVKFRQGNVDRDRQMAALKVRGSATIEDLRGVGAITAKVNPYSKQMRYCTNYDLGDWVNVKSKEYGISMFTQISSIIETYDSHGSNLVVTFGRYYLTERQQFRLDI